jgi:hypothetical protein
LGNDVAWWGWCGRVGLRFDLAVRTRDLVGIRGCDCARSEGTGTGSSEFCGPPIDDRSGAGSGHSAIPVNGASHRLPSVTRLQCCKQADGVQQRAELMLCEGRRFGARRVSSAFGWSPSKVTWTEVSCGQQIGNPLLVGVDVLIRRRR